MNVIEELTIRRADIDDSMEIWEWRNNETTRLMSINTEMVDWGSHSNWYEKSLRNQNRQIYIGSTKLGGKIGMCRFDIDATGRSAETSINLNPLHRGKHLSHRLLSLCIDSILSEIDLDLKATIRRNNIASVKCFARCGFLLDREDDDYEHYTFQYSRWRPSSIIEKTSDVECE